MINLQSHASRGSRSEPEIDTESASVLFQFPLKSAILLGYAAARLTQLRKALMLFLSGIGISYLKDTILVWVRLPLQVLQAADNSDLLRKAPGH